jgi:predicted ribosomally synthesized peptide with nif11-like leader
MSIESVAAFLEKANQDVTLQGELSTLVEGKEETACAPFIELAGRHGFEFTIEELHEVLDALRAQDSEGELTDDHLEQVAGGRPEFQINISPRVAWMSKPIFAMVYSVPDRGARYH